MRPKSDVRLKQCQAIMNLENAYESDGGNLKNHKCKHHEVRHR
jgi:hypothetical protein